jgi:hypothetical protein
MVSRAEARFEGSCAGNGIPIPLIQSAGSKTMELTSGVTVLELAVVLLCAGHQSRIGSRLLKSLRLS